MVKSFEKEKTVIASTIIIAIDKKNNRYIFDGQQRTHTIYQLLKYLHSEQLHWNSLKEYLPKSVSMPCRFQLHKPLLPHMPGTGSWSRYQDQSPAQNHLL